VVSTGVFYYIVPNRGVKYCRQCVCVFVCDIFVCLSVRLHIFKKIHVQILLNFLKISPVAVAWSSAHDNAMCYVLLVLWGMSCFHIMVHIQWL